jgi:hypothetical protein
MRKLSGRVVATGLVLLATFLYRRADSASEDRAVAMVVGGFATVGYWEITWQSGVEGETEEKNDRGNERGHLREETKGYICWVSSGVNREREAGGFLVEE